MDDSFADAPVSIAEIKSDKSNRASDIGPRDLLISILREIDRGEIEPTAMIVVFTQDQIKTCFRAASPSGLLTLGMLTRALHKYNEPD